MSRYLIQRIEASPKITLHTHKQIVELRGGDRLESICWQSKGGEAREAPARHLFLFLGAEPAPRGWAIAWRWTTRTSC
jgi:thioredoxin reductase (NADPH)